MDAIVNRLLAEQDLKYRDFNKKLVPNIDPETMIGVRTPTIRKIAREVMASGMAADFLAELPHRYFEENVLHGAIISAMGDYDAAVRELDRFLPYVDNWAVCDMTSPKSFKKCPPGLINEVQRWLGSEHAYTVRFAIGTLMSHYLDASFEPEYMDEVAAVKSDEYYVNMMVAWYFATALAKQYDCAVKYIEARSLDTWTHNKAIQKALESYRVTEEHKAYLRTLKLR